MKWNPQRGSVEPQRKKHAHQLLGAPSSSFGCKVFCQRQNKLTHPSQDGQYVSPDIHQQARGNNLPTTEQPGKGIMVVVNGEEHCPQSLAPGRCAQHHS